MTDPISGTSTTPVTGTNSTVLSPHRLSLDLGPTWMSPTSGSPTLSGFTAGARLGQSYRMSERWNWAFQGVFSYSNYFAEHGNISRVGFGFETGPELVISPQYLTAAFYLGLQQAFYYSPEVTWDHPGGTASFDNQAVTALSIRPSLQWFGGVLSTDFEFGHDFGLIVPSNLPYGVASAAEVNRYSFLLSIDLMKAFYTARGGFTGNFDGLDEFIRGIQLSALVEGTYNYSFNNPAGSDGDPAANPYRPNTPHHNRLRLNMMALGIERPSTGRSPFGFRVLSYFGQDAGVFIPQHSLQEPVIGEQGEPDTQYFALKQAYLSYRFPVLEGLTMQAGIFPTPVGTEVPEAALNSFLLPTRGLLSNFQPTNHAGVKFTLRTSESRNSEDVVQDFTEVVLGVANGWDSVLGHEGGPTAILAFNHQVNTRFTYALNYLIGAQDGGALGLFDANAIYQPVDHLSLGANIDVGHGHDVVTGNTTRWFGLGLFQQYNAELASWLTLAPAAREEVFVDPDGARSAVSQNLVSFTGAVNVLFPYGFGVAPEIRHDISFEREATTKAPFLSESNPSNSQTTFTLRAFWKYPF